MSVYIAPYTFNFQAQLVVLDSGVTDVDVTDLYTAIKEAQANEEGILHGQIAQGSGLVDLGGGVQVGITVEMLESWQLKFAAGSYVSRVTGGNLVGGPGGDPIAYSAGVQTLLIQSAASTVVSVGGGGGSNAPTAAQNAAAVWAHAQRGLTEQVDANLVQVKGQTVNGSGSEADPWGP
jgi:hypothetical protein